MSVDHKAEQCKDVVRQGQEIKELQNLVARLQEDGKRSDENHRKNEESIKQLFMAQEGTKVYVTQILNKLESLETKLFTWAQDQAKELIKVQQDAIKAQAEADKQQSKERTTAQKVTADLIKYIVGGTIGALILYELTKGAVR